MVEPDENIEDKEKCPTLSPSDDDEDLSDEDGSGTGELCMYHWSDTYLLILKCRMKILSNISSY